METDWKEINRNSKDGYAHVVVMGGFYFLLCAFPCLLMYITCVIQMLSIACPLSPNKKVWCWADPGVNLPITGHVILSKTSNLSVSVSSPVKRQ